MGNRNPKLTAKEQIQLMKDKGIRFNIMSEEAALSYIENDTYYFKLKPYADLYEKDKDGKYKDLEFAYLKDLAIIDSILRKKLLLMSLDIEHHLKVLLLKDFNRSDEDGYQIIDDLIATNKSHYDTDFKRKSAGLACSRIVNKYKDNYAIWNVIEIISFADFEELYKFFYERNGKALYPDKPESQKGPYVDMFTPVRLVRNTAAHNNTFLNNLVKPFFKLSKINQEGEIYDFFLAHNIDKEMIDIHMQNPFCHDVLSVLHLYYLLMPKDDVIDTFTDLQNTYNGRFVRHADYYEGKNETLYYSYLFGVVTLDIYLNELKK